MSRSVHVAVVVVSGLVALSWGLSFFFIRLSLDVTDPFGIALARSSIGALVLVVIPASRRPVPMSAFGSLVLLALVWMVIPMVLFPVAEKRLDSALAGILNGAAPLFTAVLAATLSRTAPPRGLVAALLVGFCGVVLVCVPTLRPGSAIHAPSVAVVVVAVALYGVAFNLAAPLQRRYGTLPVVLRALTISAVLLAPLGTPELLAADLRSPAVPALYSLGVISTGLAFAGFTWLAGRTDATRASIVTFMVPVVATLAGVLLAGERPRPLAYAGLTLVLAGGVAVHRVKANQHFDKGGGP